MQELCQTLPTSFPAVALGWPGVEIERVPIRLEMQDGYLYERVDARGMVMNVVRTVEGDEFSEFWLRVVTGERSIVQKSKRS